ncbi:MAG: DUF1588 domain-containing protein, partial [Planctomycetales bacterium]|nr:DUF1588 domain-containing protein [Planctomycetales bacterium]
MSTPLAILYCTVVLASMVRGEDLLNQAELVAQGKAIYENTCAVCHGKNGEGVEQFAAEPLVGDLPVGPLADVIAETMPEDDPESCVGQDAQAVAAYIHGAFYGEVAQIKNRPPRVSLARLTKNQLRQSLADLYSYNGNIAWSAQDHGIKGLYYVGSKPENRNKQIERTDPVIDFDFGDVGPGEGINPKDFCIDWRGALRADSTGVYEIVIRSSCAFVCYFGTYERKFIDNHVQSGERTEFRRKIVLTAGRSYPLRIDFYQRERKTEQPPANISLSWITPQTTEQIIPARNLLPIVTPAAFSLQTQLPPDDRTYGYERGITVNRQWDESTTEAALEFAQIAAEELWPTYQRKNQNKADENRAQLRGFLEEIVATAFRGPLDEDDRKLYVDASVDATADDIEAIKRSLLLALKSPRFLYPMLDTDRSLSQRVANRLALTLYDSLPTDTWLFLQARGNDLETEQQIRAAAERMVYDDRTRSKTREFLHQWLNISDVGEITKDSAAFEGFDQSLVSDLRSSLDALLDDIVWTDASDYRKFFSADWTYTTNQLAEFYGESWQPIDAEGQGLRLSISAPEHHLGILTHPYLMSKLAYFQASSPIHRGVFLIRHVLGRTIRPPEDAFVPLAPELHPDLTTRARVELQTSAPTCQVCHEKINGLGFALENLDAVGRYRTTERNQPINSLGFYTTRDGSEQQFQNPQQLA